MKNEKLNEEYIMKNVQKDLFNQAIFFNTIQTVYREKEEEFLIAGEVLKKNYDQDDSVRYYFNSLGYRSDEFTKFHDGEHILFAGCSETEGMGGALESCWSYMVYKKLSETKKISGFFNLSKGGWGHDVIISNIMQYISAYGKPNKIYMLLPELARSFKWLGTIDETEKYLYINKTPYYVAYDTRLANGKIKERQSLEEQRNLVPRFINLLKLFEEYCASNDIEFVWSTHSFPDGKNHKALNVFKNFIEMPGLNDTLSKMKREDSFDEELYNKKNLLDKRDGHRGYLFHYHWSQRFLGLTNTDSV
jgi:hypothetical protein